MAYFMKKTSANKFDRILVFPITEVNQFIFNIQQIPHEIINESILIRLDPNEWINFSMIIKLKEFEEKENNRQQSHEFVLFSRPLIKELLFKLLQNLLNLKSYGYDIFDNNLDEVWVKFQIEKNNLHMKQVVVLSQMVKNHDLKGDCKICKQLYKLQEQLILPILKFYNISQDKELIQSGLKEKIEIIRRQRPYKYYFQDFGRHYTQTNLNQFKQTYIPQLDWIDPSDEVFRNTLINEFYYYRLPVNEDLVIQLQSKYQFIKEEINNYLKQFEYLFEQFCPNNRKQIKESINKIIQQKIEIIGYANYVNSFLQFDFQISNFIQKQKIFYIFFEVIHQLENNIKTFGLLLILDDILTNQQKYYSVESQFQLQQNYNNYSNELKDKVVYQLRNFYKQLQYHIQFNESIEDQIFQHIDLEFILQTLCQQFKARYTQWNDNKDMLIKQILNSEQQIIKEVFFKAISSYIQTL